MKNACIHPSCSNSRRTRGLCHGHYQTMRAYVRAGKATEADLMARGLLMAKGTGGSKVADHDVFLLGSKVRGKAAALLAAVMLVATTAQASASAGPNMSRNVRYSPDHSAGSTRLRALDLFCGAGGATGGLQRAGFRVTGIDIAAQPNYPGRFIQGDWRAALRQIDPDDFDFIWASPPCLKFTAYRRRKGHVKPAKNLIPGVRRWLKATGKPYVIENVPAAGLREPFQLCGSSFALDIRRHRHFESNFKVNPPPCDHSWQTPRFPPAGNRVNLRSTVEVGVWRIPLDVQQRAMGIDWMTRPELSKAVPPAYSEFIARAWLKQKGLTK